MTITFKLQPLDNYAFGLKDAQQEEDTTIAARVQRLIDEYKTDGMRMSVEAVIVFHQHGHPHILLLQTPDNYFKLQVIFYRINIHNLLNFYIDLEIN